MAIMKSVSLRVPEETKDFVEALAALTPDSESSDIMRHAMTIGVRVLAALIPPDAQSGKYGNVSPDRVAVELRPYGILIADYLTRYGHAMPLVAAEASVDASHASQVAEARLEIIEVDSDMADMMSEFGSAL